MKTHLKCKTITLHLLQFPRLHLLYHLFMLKSWITFLHLHRNGKHDVVKSDETGLETVTDAWKERRV